MALGMIVPAFVFGWGPINDMDTFLHLAMGRWMVYNRAVMHTDPWTFTEPGARVIPHEWLFQLVQYVTWKIGGPEGLAGLRVALTWTMLMACVMWAVRAGASMAVAPAGALMALMFAAPRLSDRPHLFTFFAVPLLGWLLESLRQTGHSAWGVAVGALLFLWAQCHGGVLYGWAMVGCFAADAVLAHLAASRGATTTAEMRSESLARCKTWGAAFVLGGAAACLGPARHEALFYAVLTLGKLRAAGVATLEFGVRLGDIPGLLLVGAMALATAAVAWRGGWRNARFGFLLAMFLVAAVGAARDRALWVLLAVGPLGAWLVEALRGSKPQVRLLCVGALYLAPLVPTLMAIRQQPADLQHPPLNALLPNGAVQFVIQENLGRRVLAPDYMGAYITWESDELLKTFMDARMDAWSTTLLREHSRAIYDLPGRRDVMRDRGVETVILDYPTAVAGMGIPPGLRGSAFASSDTLSLVYWDDTAMVFVAREALATRSSMEMRGLRPFSLINPADPGPDIARATDAATSTPARLQAMESELRRAMALAPNASYPARLLGHLLAVQGRAKDAAGYFFEAIQRAEARGDRATAEDYAAWVGCLVDAGDVEGAAKAAARGEAAGRR